MEHASAVRAWARTVAGQALWSGAALVTPALAVLADRQVAQAVALYTCETLLATVILKWRVGRVLRGLAFDDAVAVRLRAAGGVATTAGFVSLILGFLLLVFYVAYDVRPSNLFDVDAWGVGHFAGFVGRAQWMVAGLLAGAVLDAWMAPVRSPEWLESSAAWQLRRVAAPAFAYLPGAALTAWMGTSAGFLWPWLATRGVVDLLAVMPGARERARQAVFPAQSQGRHGAPVA